MSVVTCPGCSAESYPDQYCDRCGRFIPIPGAAPAEPDDGAAASEPAEGAAARLLRQLGLQEYTEAFQAQDIDDLVLPDLTEEDLRALGVESVGHRRRILAALPRPEVPDDDDDDDDSSTGGWDALRSPAGIAGMILIVAFFMPWLGIFGLGGSGFDILRLGMKHEPMLMLLAVSPVCAAVALASLAGGVDLLGFRILAGVGPWLLLGFVVFKVVGSGLPAGRILVEGTDYGLWLSLVSGVVLVVGRRP